MPKKNAKPQKTNELDAKEFFIAIDMIEKERGIPKSYMLEKITQALTSAYKKDPAVAGQKNQAGQPGGSPPLPSPCGLGGRDPHRD